MKMHRFYCHSSQFSDKFCELQGSQARHAFGVLRLKAGDLIGLIDEASTDYVGVIEAVRGMAGRVRLVGVREKEPENMRLALAQAIPKGTGFDSLVDRATQLGVSVIIPMITERTIVRVGPERLAAKRERWQRKALEAVKQCGRTSLPAVLPVHSFSEVLTLTARYERVFLGSLQPDAVPIQDVLPGEVPRSALVMIGPEGDFTLEEYRRAAKANIIAVSLGARVLRCELAATLLLGIVCYEWRC